jgi:hypothetical protein
VGKFTIEETLKFNFSAIGLIRVSVNKEIIDELKLFKMICIIKYKVFRGGLEPPTKRFSVFYSTIELPKQKVIVLFFLQKVEEDLDVQIKIK